MTETELRIEKLVYGGDGLARENGQVVLTPFVLPGETVRAEVTRAKNDLLRGRLVSVVSPAPQRVEPRCPYFLRCGGCHYQHASYEYQLEQKRVILLEVLRRIGGIEYSEEVAVLAAEPWQYRNRVQLHIAGGKIGYFEAGSHALVAIEDCPIASPKLNECIAVLAREVAGMRPFDATLELFTNENDVQFHLRDRVPQPFVSLLRTLGVSTPIEYGGLRVSRDTFFQVNRFLTEKLVEATLDDSNGRWAMDLYAGAGLFTLPLARRFQQVTAVDDAASAFRDLEHNASAAGIMNLRTHNETAEAHLMTVTDAPNLMIADPPRTGLGKLGVKELVRIRAPRLTIVSCDPATLARDLKPLLAAGYRMAALTLIDLFPQTAHFESIAKLEL
ncbi:MAG: class I SAM-dependent RNA methyltransferase [Bryobacteraceae bacterium]